jgi:hypothetical protein
MMQYLLVSSAYGTVVKYRSRTKPGRKPGQLTWPGLLPVQPGGE